jgi:multisubunit Na+/H+ antiporter MnhB subunit
MKQYLRNQEVLTGIVVALCTAIYFSQTFSIRRVPLFPISAAFLPKICAVFMFGLAVILIIQGIRQERAAPAAKPSEMMNRAARKRNSAVGTALGILFLTILLLRPMGFIIAMSFYLLASFFTLSPREKWNIPIFAFMAVTFSIGIYLVFVKGFSLLLPAGILV